MEDAGIVAVVVGVVAVSGVGAYIVTALRKHGRALNDARERKLARDQEIAAYQQQLSEVEAKLFVPLPYLVEPRDRAITAAIRYKWNLTITAGNQDFSVMPVSIHTTYSQDGTKKIRIMEYIVLGEGDKRRIAAGSIQSIIVHASSPATRDRYSVRG